MNRKLRIKITVDVLMIIALLFLMSFELVGDAAHEWIGLGMLLLSFAHHFLNRKWTGNLRKGRYTPLRIIQTVLVVSLLGFMVGSMISGIILSNYLFRFVKIKGAANMARNIHMLCAYWGFLFMSVHLGIHWNMMVGMVGKATKGNGKYNMTVKWIARGVAAAIAIYGVYAFWKRNIAEYLFLIAHFVFFDFNESLIRFLLDYMAIMGLFVFVTHYVCKWIQSRRLCRLAGKNI